MSENIVGKITQLDNVRYPTDVPAFGAPQFKPSMSLRFVLCDSGDAGHPTTVRILQQLWTAEAWQKFEWRDVPLEQE